MKYIISGINGKMGKTVAEKLIELNEEIVCGIDRMESDGVIPVYNDFNKAIKGDVIIDFSSPKALDGLLDYAVKTHTPAVLCTTGYTEEDEKKVYDVSKKVALFRSANMSVGVNILLSLIEQAVKSLPDYDVEIVEMHHNMKKDSPSGTALMLAEKVKEVYPDRVINSGRTGASSLRDKKEIGVHSLRGGNVVGEHSVILAGTNEVITLSHSASSRAVFADGAIKASKFIVRKDKGLFNMDNLLKELNA